MPMKNTLSMKHFCLPAVLLLTCFLISLNSSKGACGVSETRNIANCIGAAAEPKSGDENSDICKYLQSGLNCFSRGKDCCLDVNYQGSVADILARAQSAGCADVKCAGHLAELAFSVVAGLWI